MKRFVCIDIEMSELTAEERRMVPDLQHEIIQIGAVMLDENYNIINRFSSYIKPSYSSVTPVIQSLTGISNRDLLDAKDFISVFDKYLYWLEDNEIITFCWSAADYKQLWNEITVKAKHRKDLFENLKTFIDLQRAFGNLIGTKISISLESALIFLCDEFKGKAHDAYWDAYNTARILHKIKCTDSININMDYIYKLSNDNDCVPKKYKVKIADSKDYTNTFASFMSPELLEQFGYKPKEKVEIDKEADENIINEDSLKYEKEELEAIKKSSVADIFDESYIRGLCLKYKVPVFDWLNIAEKVKSTNEIGEKVYTG
ncbi:MAG: exonuclease domain-containing protein [Treponema sp.]|nr:exonuclease domain-containing protein [Treponema sp.]